VWGRASRPSCRGGDARLSTGKGSAKLSNSVRYIRHHVLITTALLFLFGTASRAQDWIRTGTGLGVEKVRLAAADFKPSTNDAKNAELLKTFNDVLWNDLRSRLEEFLSAAGAGATVGS